MVLHAFKFRVRFHQPRSDYSKGFTASAVDDEATIPTSPYSVAIFAASVVYRLSICLH